MNLQTQKTVGIRLSRIKVLSFYQYELENVDINKDSLVQYQNNIQARIDKDSSEIAIQATIKVMTGEFLDEFSQIKVECVFGVSPLDAVIKESGDEFELPSNLITHLTSIVIGTVRGILYEKLKGTPIADQVLPLIDPKSFVNNNE